MSLAGQGAVAIWHDIAPEGRDAFYAWHGREHMPERLAIPGFLRGRRYAALAGAPEFFNLYETESRLTVTGIDYLARLNAPTPWTVASVAHFRNVARSLCEVAATFGAGQGGLVATLRYGVPDERADLHRKRMTEQVLPQWADAAGIAGCHLLVADEVASAVETAEKRVRAEKNTIPRWIVLVEGWSDDAAFRASCADLATNAAFVAAAAPPDLGIYRLQNSCARLSRPVA